MPHTSIATYRGIKKQEQKLEISQPGKLFSRVLTEIEAVLWLLTSQTLRKCQSWEES